MKDPSLQSIRALSSLRSGSTQRQVVASLPKQRNVHRIGPPPTVSLGNSFVMISPHLQEVLRCPLDHSELQIEGDYLVSKGGNLYPVVHGIPVFLHQDMGTTIDVEENSLQLARRHANGEQDDLFVDTLGISETEKQDLLEKRDTGEDPVVSYLIGATNGLAYKGAIGALERIPVPDLRLSHAEDDNLLLDIGCSWGRWCLAAARKGYISVGLDPSLGAVLAAKRLAEQQGTEAFFVVGDARYLPFRQEVFDVVFSYSVLQHFSKGDTRACLAQVRSVLRPGGQSKIQMAAKYGIRSLYHQWRREREPESFDVRYWSPPELRQTFEEHIGPTDIEVDCYFGLGLQPTDVDLMTPVPRWATYCSEALRALSRPFLPLRYVADSLYLNSKKIAK